MLSRVDHVNNPHSQDLDQSHEKDNRPGLLPKGTEVLQSHGSPCVHLDAIFGRLGLLRRRLKSFPARHGGGSTESSVGSKA